MKQLIPYLIGWIRILLFILVGGMFSWITKLSLRESSMYWPSICIFVNLITIGWIAIDLKKHQSSYSTLLKVLFQKTSAKEILKVTLIMLGLGIVSGKDLAQASSSHYPKQVNFTIWILSEIEIISTDIAEVLGSAIGISLVFNLSIVYGVIITAFDTILLLIINRLGICKMEAFIVLLIFIIGASFLVEIFLSKPDYQGILSGFVPSIPNQAALYIGIGIIGATIMPHNLYLHSSLVQTRNYKKDHDGYKQAIKFNIIDSVVALNIAFLVNAAILIVAAAVFFETGNYGVGDILTAHQMLEPILGSKLAPILFGIALIAAGQSSTITGTYAGQIVMEGFIHLRLQPWVRRVITRLLAIIPALLVILLYGESATVSLLILSQVILSLQLSFAVVPLIHFVSSKKFMNEFAIKLGMKIIAWSLAALIMTLNIILVVDTLKTWVLSGISVILYTGLIIFIGLLIGLLIYIIFEPLLNKGKQRDRVSIHHLTNVPLILKVEPYRKIALALDFTQNDQAILSHAVHLSGAETEFVLFHVVESAGASIYGDKINDDETKIDSEMLENYATTLRNLGIYSVKTQIGYGKPTDELPKMIQANAVDLVVFGTHGHKGITDLLFGSVLDKIKHRIDIPMLIANLKSM